MSALGVLLLLLMAVFASTLGALGGLGGAFIALPILRLAGIPAQTAASAALAMAFANAASASYEYLRQRRVDLRVAGFLAVTGVPASILGAYAVQHVSGRAFDFALAALQVCIAGSLIWRTRLQPRARTAGNRRIRDAFGVEHVYDLSPPVLLGAGAVVGFAASFFGIGGGILMVPLMILGLGMPAHFATATSTFAILLMSPAGIATHFVLERSAWQQTLELSAILAAGGLAGGQIGARIAPKLNPKTLTWVFALLLLVSSAALIVRHAL